jgi:hypothetical protein
MSRGRYRREDQLSSQVFYSSYISSLDERYENNSETNLSEPKLPNNQNNITQNRCKTLYADPEDDADENLSDVPSDYGQSRKTIKLQSRLIDRWSRLVFHKTCCVSLTRRDLTKPRIVTAKQKRSSHWPTLNGTMPKPLSTRFPRTMCIGS